MLCLALNPRGAKFSAISHSKVGVSLGATQLSVVKFYIAKQHQLPTTFNSLKHNKAYNTKLAYMTK